MVKIYLTERVIDGSRYGEEICARSLEEAREIAARIGSTVLGTSEEQCCARCGEVLRSSSEVLGDNEWPNELNAG